jgi:DNA-binding SARP family transcriptional activator
MHEQCLSAVEKGLEIANISGIHMWDTFLIGHAAMSCHNVGDSREAQRYIELLAPYDADPRPWVQANMDFVKARHAMICGNLDEAARCTLKGLRLESKAAAPSIFCMHRVLYAHILHRLDRDSEAAELISQAETIAERIGSEHFKVMIGFYRAQEAFDRGKEDEGLDLLRTALPLAREWGSLGSLWDIPSSTAVLCSKALEAGIETDFVREIVRRRHLAAHELSAYDESWPWPVKVFTLGRFQILRDDAPLAFSKKAQKKPLEMLKTLIALKGSQVSQSHVADILWPDADGDLAMQACATTLHRLRRLLGNPEAILLQNGLLTVDPRCCWVDAWSFSRLMDRAEALFEKAGSEADMEEACKAACTAVDLYKGEFLPGDEWNPDVFSMQESLKDRFIKTVSRMGERLVEKGQWEMGAHIYQKGLARDDCSEEFYLGIMTCLEKQGRRTEAVAVFERCRRTLAVKLGVKPSPGIEARGKMLRTGREV